MFYTMAGLISILFAAGDGQVQVVVDRDVAVPMRDGTILRADVWRPDGGGPYPVLVMRTPYNKRPRKFDRFVKAGYIVVCQDARGRYASDGAWGRRKYGPIDFGPEAAVDTVAVEIRWFDYWLKGKQNGVDKDAPVRIFIMGENRWRDERQWPLERTRDKALYLTSGGGANTPDGDGKLVADPPAGAGSDRYVYDPADPVPTLHGKASFTHAADQRPLANRRDILVYQSEPLAERLEVTGNPVVELYAATSAPDTDWIVRLIDVAPDGLARDVSMGLVRARYRHGLDKPQLVEPGAAVKYTIRMNPTSNAFLPGHRIRLDVTSSDFPNYDRNHNTAADPSADAELKTADQTVYHGGDRATRIVLPWVPNVEVPKVESPTQ